MPRQGLGRQPDKLCDGQGSADAVAARDKAWAVPHTHAEAVVKTLKAVAAPVRYELYPGASHRCIGATPDQINESQKPH